MLSPAFKCACRCKPLLRNIPCCNPALLHRSCRHDVPTASSAMRPTSCLINTKLDRRMYFSCWTTFSPDKAMQAGIAWLVFQSQDIILTRLIRRCSAPAARCPCSGGRRESARRARPSPACRWAASAWLPRGPRARSAAPRPASVMPPDAVQRVVPFGSHCMGPQGRASLTAPTDYRRCRSHSLDTKVPRCYGLMSLRCPSGVRAIFGHACQLHVTSLIR